MAIVSSDIITKLSVKTGTSGNSTTQSDQNQSLGLYISTTTWLGGALHDLYSPITGLQNSSGAVDYRCVFIYNANGSLTFSNITVWISAQTAGGADFAIAVDSTAATALNSAAPQALSVANANTPPAGLTFSMPTTEATGLALGQLLAGQVRAIWIRRTANNSAPINNDGGTISISGDSAA